MRLRSLHTWNLTLREAQRLQARLARRVRTTSSARPALRLVAGADMSHARFSPWLYGAVVVLRLPDFSIVETVTARRKASFPYVPGYLSFREGPVLLDCFARLRTRPDAVLFDGHGLAHPRRFGLACHLGLWLGIASVGCAKSRLCGQYAEPGPARGDRAPLLEAAERLGTALRTRPGARPVLVSVGQRLDLREAEALVLACTDGRHRLPEPLRQAHARVNAMRKESERRARAPFA